MGELICVVCKKPLTAENCINLDQADWDMHGHNAAPLAEGRCCNGCNIEVVKERLRLSDKARRRSGGKRGQN
jgi:hypothetical protein